MDKYLARQIQESDTNARHKAKKADVMLFYMLLGHVGARRRQNRAAASSRKGVERYGRTYGAVTTENWIQLVQLRHGLVLDSQEALNPVLPHYCQ